VAVENWEDCPLMQANSQWLVSGFPLRSGLQRSHLNN
jgi:hypothetical protein